MARRRDSREGPQPEGWGRWLALTCGPAPWPSPRRRREIFPWASLVGSFSLGVGDDRVAAELVAHHREHAVAEGVFHTAPEAGKERLGNDRHGHGLFDRRL